MTEGWKTAATLVARLIFAGVFAMAAAFKFWMMGLDATTGEIAKAGFANPLLLSWMAGLLEIALALAFLTGLYFSEAAIVAAVYVLFLGFSFHGPDKFAANPMEFGFFVDHFTFIAGLLFAAVHGPGDRLVLTRRRSLTAT